MYRTTTVRRTLLAGAAAVITLVGATACAGPTGADQQPQTPAGSTATATVNDADVAFAQMMIVHHVQAVEIATLAQQKTTDPELRQIADGIRAAEESEIEIATMTGWLRSWGKPTATPTSNMGNMGGLGGMGGGDAPGMMSEQDMSNLRQASGVDFDRMFARMMITQDSGGIQMCQSVAAKGASPDVRALAATIEQAQSAEVARLQTTLDRL
jgi:uncharacterized protein (DUF305 family)